MNTTEYTTFSAAGTVIFGQQSLEAAAIALLTYDGHRYEIRAQDGGFALYVTRRSDASYAGNGGFAEWPNYWATTHEGVCRNVVVMGGVKGSYAVAAGDDADPG